MNIFAEVTIDETGIIKQIDAVLAELEKRNSAAAQAEEQRIEAEKRAILDDLYLYGM